MMDVETIDYAKERTLIVDDEAEFGEILEDLLKRKGFKSHHVINGNEALSELRKHQNYTFVITDIVMPGGIDGLELTKTIKDEFPEICVIVMTGYSDDYKYIAVVNSGATDFINKPFRIEELEAKIRRGIIERNTKQELKRLTITDSLTGLYNQRHFYSRLNDEILRSKRRHADLALILLDLDNFKNYNDNHGHVSGNELLQKFSSILKAQIREGVDSGYRYGGDEFSVILIDANAEICKHIEERIARVFKEECNEHVSMGYAIHQEGMSPKDFVAEADKHLYTAKRKKKQTETDQLNV